MLSIIILILRLTFFLVCFCMCFDNTCTEMTNNVLKHSLVELVGGIELVGGTVLVGGTENVE